MARNRRRASIPKGKDPASVTFEEAMRYLSLPREVGLHPETKTPIVANVGRFGPYLLHDGVYANLKDPDDVYTVGLNRAVDLLHEKRSRGPSNRARPGALKNLGPHPDGGGNVEIMGGRYGAYVKHGKVNATLPKDKTHRRPDAWKRLSHFSLNVRASPAARKAAKKTAKKPAAKKAAKKAARNPPPARHLQRKLPRRREAASAPDAPRPRQRQQRPACPDEAEILEFIATSPGVVGKRDIARAFGLTGNAKIGLKAMLKDLEHKGALDRKGKRLGEQCNPAPRHRPRSDGDR
jgi:hypothetical protein